MTQKRKKNLQGLNNQLFVNPAGNPTGNGSENTPFKTITQALQVAGDNSVIVVNSTGSALRTEEEVITAEVSKLSVNAFPNPSNSYFSIAVKGNNNEKMTMRVFDLYGRKLEERVVNNGAIVKIGEGYGAGVYFVSIQQGENRKELKLIKMTE